MLTALGSHMFLATYASAGVLTSFSSLCLSVARRSPSPSLGASGVLFAFAGITAAAYPELKFSLILLEPLVWLLGKDSSDFAVPAPFALGGLVKSYKRKYSVHLILSDDFLAWLLDDARLCRFDFPVEVLRPRRASSWRSAWYIQS